MKNHASFPLILKATGLVGLLAAVAVPLQAQIEVVSGGNVGVGTSSPGNKFTVEGTGDVAAVGSSTKKFYFTPDANGVGLFTGASKTGNSLYADITNNALVFSTNGTERYRVDSSGRIGIGTTSPSFPLSLGTTTGNKIALYDAGSGAGYGLGYQSNLLQIFANTASDRVGIGYGSSGSFTETLSVKGANVGIGTTSPSAKLEIYGSEFRVRDTVSKTNTGLRQLFRLTSDDSIGPSNLEMVFSLQGATSGGGRYAQIQVGDNGYWWGYLVLNPYGGNVGIGTSTPSQKLEVAGSVRATSFISNSTTYADFVFERSYRLPSLNEVEAQINELGHLPGIPSEAEAREHGIDLTAMQVKLLQKVEELTLHQIAQEKKLTAQSTRIERLEAENIRLRNAAHR